MPALGIRSRVDKAGFQAAASDALDETNARSYVPPPDLPLCL